MSTLTTMPLQFPSAIPDGFPQLTAEPSFDPAKHLAIEMPETVYSLDDFGYAADEIADCPSNIAATSAFRLLSDEGIAALQDVTKQLEQFTRSNPAHFTNGPRRGLPVQVSA